MNSALPDPSGELARGIALVAGSAVVWSFGGAIARFIHVGDDWTVIFWRAIFAALFLLVFMLVRDGPKGTIGLLKGTGIAGLAVATCFTIASVAFIVALGHTTVANILLMQAGAPLIAALLTWGLFGERIGAATWAAILCVFAGVAIMVSQSFTGKVSPLGDGLALVISVSVATATVLTRRFAHVRMTPAVFMSSLMQAGIGWAMSLSSQVALSASDFGLLFVFGALNLGFGLSLFVTGVELVPAAMAALVGTLEPILGPIWVWLLHGEVPGIRTMVGGALVFVALVAHLTGEWLRQSRKRPPTQVL